MIRGKWQHIFDISPCTYKTTLDRKYFLYTFYGKVVLVCIKNVCKSIEKEIQLNDYDNKDSAYITKNLHAPNKVLMSVAWFNLEKSNFSKMTHWTIVSQRATLKLIVNSNGKWTDPELALKNSSLKVFASFTGHFSRNAAKFRSSPAKNIIWSPGTVKSSKNYSFCLAKQFRLENIYFNSKQLREFLANSER